jgi:hypothetical protein
MAKRTGKRNPRLSQSLKGNQNAKKRGSSKGPSNSAVFATEIIFGSAIGAAKGAALATVTGHDPLAGATAGGAVGGLNKGSSRVEQSILNKFHKKRK